MNSRRWTVASIVIFSGIGTAWAQDSAPPPDGASCPPGTVPSTMERTEYIAPEQPPPAPVQETRYKRTPLFAPMQVAISVGGGVSNFVRDRIRDTTTPSGAWDVRLLAGARSPLAFEAGYLGTAARAHDPIDKPAITTTQLFGSARLQLPWIVQPFASAGVGWVLLHRTSNAVESPVATTNFRERNENGVVVPLGGGVAVYPIRHALIEARGDYRLMAAAKDFTTTGQRPDMWSAQLRAGYAF